MKLKTEHVTAVREVTVIKAYLKKIKSSQGISWFTFMIPPNQETERKNDDHGRN